MDIVYIFKETSIESIDLRFSLRGIEKNLKHDRVFIIGDKPTWIKNIIHIPVKNIGGSKFIDIAYKFLQLSKNEELSSDFITMWDDIFIITPIDKIPCYKGELLSTILKLRPNHNNHWKSLKYVLNLFPEGFNYDLHRPYVYNKENLKKLFEKYKYTDKFSIRSLYCNEFPNEEVLVVKDIKIRNINSLLEKREMISTTDSISKNIEFQKYISKHFPLKSKFEK